MIICGILRYNTIKMVMRWWNLEEHGSKEKDSCLCLTLKAFSSQTYQHIKLPVIPNVYKCIHWLAFAYNDLSNWYSFPFMLRHLTNLSESSLKVSTHETFPSWETRLPPPIPLQLTVSLSSLKPPWQICRFYLFKALFTSSVYSLKVDTSPYLYLWCLGMFKMCNNFIGPCFHFPFCVSYLLLCYKLVTI